MIIISDANVIVYFWRAELLNRLHTSINVQITEKIYLEITKHHRLLTSYPDLALHIQEHRHNSQIANPITVVQVEAQYRDETDIEMHYHLNDESGLDDGEIEGILLSVISGKEFVTSELKAVEYFNDILDHNSEGKARDFESFLGQLFDGGVINQAEKKRLIEIKMSKD